ncbi:hypothetical protein TBLA_0D00310 [Henningerozyma blattae CBS 6284]|uniref:DNA-directed RNA polymerase III subunit n=1 Tax=Henningerozyma blattae (strain ATCC 34711 / CBS 6284 / DSM 70876 / NBRC 10599 / NRRL Y-10934 / UCD 77-7) TaxID=1071380 RepID=I2H2D9_HENB6|nr:hypothetical protein TBLA_0D00310 [Tetrapisispora blattae CBS 6284]CCH60541.1 hypothetical protein TBLA_0D00310 [Tetrapisispora blattae CBS 6284]
MSFRRGGRGGGNAGGNSFLSNLPFGLGYGDVGKNDSTENPVVPLPVNNPITSKERSIAVSYIKFVENVREGPFYTSSISISIMDKKDKKNEEKKDHDIVEEGSINDGIERYSDKYLKKRKIGASIDDHPYYLPVFPKELYQVMGINKKKLLSLSNLNKKDDIYTGKGDSEDVGLSMLEKLKELAEDDDDEKSSNKQNAEAEEDFDEDFEEDEDGDDDYNAEKYFDDGDEDDYGDEEFENAF